MPMEEIRVTECAHCHQPIKEYHWSDDHQKAYCCYGCKVVDELMGDKAQVLNRQSLDVKKYAYLDEDRIRQKICDFEDGVYSRVSLHLPAIHCSSCIYLLENLADIEEGIQSVQVNFSRKSADIYFRNDQIALSQLAALLDHIGYPPDFQTKLGTDKPKKNRLLIQLGVAGFFFGNTMLLALPEYLDNSLAQSKDLQTFFRYLMMGFSVPVILISARDYFTTAYKGLRAGSLSIDLPIALGIIVLFLRSSYEVMSGYGSGYFDSLNSLVFFLLLGKWYQQKTYENFSFDRDLRSFLPLAANRVLPDGKEKAVSIDDLVSGDKIRVRAGEVLPADAVLLNDERAIDYSYLSGESLPVQKRKGDKVYAGARLKSEAGDFEVERSVDHSYLSSLWAREAFKEEKQSESFSDQISRYFTPAIIVIALVSAALWSVVDASKSILVLTSVLIVACPCALALAEPFAAGSIMRWFGRFGFYLKNAAVLNRIESAQQVVFDKTGTLTKPDQIIVDWHGDLLPFEERIAVASIALNAQHPLAKPLLAFLEVDKAQAQAAVAFKELSGEAVTAQVKDQYYRLGKAAYFGLDDQAQTTAVYLELDGKLKGYFSFYQELRPGLEDLAKNLGGHYKLSVLSGDNDAERKRFAQIFPQADLRFHASPHDKLNYLQDLQAKGAKVIMLGDGLNDAGALQQSEVGISLCERNVNFFPASDALLVADSFPKLPTFLALSRRYRSVVKRAFTISLLYNLFGISVAVAGYLSPLFAAILMPISSVTVVLYVSLRTAYLSRQALQGAD